MNGPDARNGVFSSAGGNATVLAVHAHPDDETWATGAALATLTQLGAVVHLRVASGATRRAWARSRFRTSCAPTRGRGDSLLLRAVRDIAGWNTEHYAAYGTRT